MKRKIYKQKSTNEVFVFIGYGKLVDKQDNYGELYVVYKHLKNGNLFIKPKLEFFNGQFIQIDEI